VYLVQRHQRRRPFVAVLERVEGADDETETKQKMKNTE
jgi:hypothetical protein